MSAKITVLKNASLKVEGDIILTDAAGKNFTVDGSKGVYLCRCGQSANKPFCDGSHKKVNFESEVIAK